MKDYQATVARHAVKSSKAGRFPALNDVYVEPRPRTRSVLFRVARGLNSILDRLGLASSADV